MRKLVTLEGGTSIDYLEEGQGEPLVYFHGGGGLFTKARFFFELARQYRVLMPARPGYDRSTGACENARDEAEAMAAFIRQVADGGPVHLMAESAGGASGCWIAVLYPELVRTLVLIAPAAFVTHRGPPVPPEERAMILFGPTPAWSGPLEPEDFAAREGNAAVTAQRGRTNAGNPELLERLGEIRAPTLILWGSADRQVPPEQGLLYKERIPDSYRMYVYGSAHVIPVAKCDQFLAVATAFLTRGEAFVVNTG